jgi:hypothetical protein
MLHADTVLEVNSGNFRADKHPKQNPLDGFV